jgi:hypothetical protein
MELLVGTPSLVSIDEIAASARWRYVGDTAFTTLSVVPVNGVTTATLGTLRKEGEVEVEWNIDGTVIFSQFYPVSTPYLSVSEAKRVWAEGSEIELLEVERAARHIINAYCGQSFGTKVESKTIKGTGTTYLPLPEKLLSLTSVVGFRYGNILTVAGGGWYLSSADTRGWVPPIRADYDELNSGTHLEGISYPPVHVPEWSSKLGNVFHAHQQYEVAGTWGWRYVPQEVKEAARLLVNDYAVGDNIYRDRFLTSMTAADWRIQFHDRAFDGTGNARADQLLNGFVLSRGWAVI